MEYLITILLGFVQGMTEFIPISSSGHLIIVREVLGVNNSGGLAFDAVLQLATSFSLLFYFRKDVLGIVKTFIGFVMRKNLSEEDRTLMFSIVVGTIPAVLVGLLLESYMETVFRNVSLVAVTLVLGSLVFYIADKFYEKNKANTKDLTLGRAITIGLFQCLALVPGMSRSGSTISGGLISGLDKDTAVRFSFILSIPILFGTGFKKLFDVSGELFVGDLAVTLLLGSITAFITGLLAINFLIKYLKNHNFNLFIWYRVFLAIVILVAVGI